MEAFPITYANSTRWIACNADKTPAFGTSTAPRFTLSQVPKAYLPGFCILQDDHIIGIDLDELPEATIADILEHTPKDAYVEFSVSGRIHIFGSYEGPRNWVNQSGKLEMYVSGRYFVTTGKIVEGFTPAKQFVDLSELVYYIRTTYLHSVTSDSESSTVPVISTDLSRVQAALAELDPDCDYESWAKYGMAVGNSFRGSEWEAEARRSFETWSQGGKKWDSKAARNIEAFFRGGSNGSGKLTIASLFADAPQVLVQEHLRDAIALFEDSPEIPEEPSHPGDAGSTPPTGEAPTISYKVHPNIVAQLFMRERHVFTRLGKKFSWWNTDRWEVDEDILLLSQAVELFIFEKGYNVVRQENEWKTVYCIHTRDLREVTEHVRRQCVRKKVPEPNKWIDVVRRASDPYVIAVENGLYSITKDAIVSELTPAFYNTGVLPCAWDPVATCSRFLEGLKMTFGGEQSEGDIQDNIECLQKWFGYLFLVGYSEKKLCILLGDADSGKSTLLRIMEILVGEQYYRALSLGDLDGRRTDSAVGFDTHFLGGYDEFPFDKKLSAFGDMIKMCTGDAKIPQRKLYAEAESVEMRMRFVFTSNTSPDYFSDPRHGLMKRFLIWKCVAVPRDRIDTNYLRYLRDNELPGILNWAVEGARKVLSGDKLRQPGGESGELYREFQSSSMGHLEQWVEEAFVEDMEGTVTNEEMRARLEEDLRQRYAEFKGLRSYLEEHNYSKRTLTSKIRHAIMSIYPKCVRFHNNSVEGLKGVRTGSWKEL